VGLTPDDIHAQRAMLQRGEKIRQAQEHHAEKARLRDTFAAAALTGLLDSDDVDALEWRRGNVCRVAYAWADAMLRERELTNHDAAPAAKPSQRNTESRQSERGTGSTQEPAAWGLPNADGEVWCVSTDPQNLERDCPTNRRLVPLYRAPSLTDSEREAIVAAIRSWPAIGVSKENVESLRGLLKRLQGL
jgi:hypothetical protein